MFLYSNLVYFFFIIYVRHYSKLFYIKYHKIIRVLYGQLTSLVQLTKVRAIQIDPVIRPTRRTNRIRPESGQLDCSGGQRRVFTTRNRFQWVSFGFPPLKQEKPEPTESFPASGQNFQNPAINFQNPMKKPRFQPYFP